MNVQQHQNLTNAIWEIANRLRGPYRPPQYRLVMLPLVVLRRLDCVLEPTKDAVLTEYAKLRKQKMPQEALDRILSKKADKKRRQPLYNISPFTFERLLGDPDNIAPNLVAFINGLTRHSFRNSEVPPFLVCSIDRCQITVEPEPSGMVLGLLQRLEDWFEVFQGLGVEPNWAGKIE